jgi:phosphoribosylanthranilate isomerase
VAALRKQLDNLTTITPGLYSGSEIPIIKAVRMETSHSLDPWQESKADYLLLDQGKGGTGTTFNHDLIEESGTIQKPWFLAGGIGAENAAESIQRFTPYALDVSSSVETDGWKDPQKIKTLIQTIRNLNHPHTKKGLQ